MEFKFLLVTFIFIQSTLACTDCINGHPSVHHDTPTRSTICSVDDGIAKFGQPEVIGKLAITGTSSLAASRKHPGYLYSVNDNGDMNVVKVLDEKDGAMVGVITILGATNNDWEEMSVGVCQDDHDKWCIYIQDAGDFQDIIKSNIYVIEEPDVITGNHDVNILMLINYSLGQEETRNIRSAECCSKPASTAAGTDKTKDDNYIATLQTSHPINIASESGWKLDHPSLPDCCTETIFIDPNGHIYFFDRQFQGENIRLYKLFQNGGVWSANPITPFLTLMSTNTGPDGSDLSPNGDELLVQFHDVIYYFKIDNNDIAGAMQRPQLMLTHRPDPDGTSVAWAANVCGFYVSNQAADPELRFTDRNGATFQPPLPGPLFTYGQVVGAVDQQIDVGFVTGMAISRDHPDYIYIIDDGSLGEVAIHVIQASNGKHVSKISLNGPINTNWADITVGPKTSGGDNYIMILDAGGDNGGPARTVITLPEPASLDADQTVNFPGGDIFTYDTSVGVSHAIAVTPTGRIFIADYQFGLNDEVTIYQLVDTNAAEWLPVRIGSFPHFSGSAGPEAMEIAPCGHYILIKNRDTNWMYPIRDGSYGRALTNADAVRLPYIPESQGFSITIAANCKSYYTIGSEGPNKLKRYSMLPGCPKPPPWS